MPAQRSSTTLQHRASGGAPGAPVRAVCHRGSERETAATPVAAPWRAPPAGALLVEPDDLAALAAALAMPPAQQRERMRAMRQFVAEFNVFRWAGRMLVDAARIRRNGRLTDRLATGGLRALRA